MAALRPIGTVQLSTVEAGAHLLAYVAPQCFVAATTAFLDGTEAPARCEKSDPQ